MLRYKQKSFTLVELIVTVSIFIMLLAVGYPLIGGTAAKESFESEADRVKSFIERAKSLAQNPENADAIGYRIDVDESGEVLVLKRIILLEDGAETTADIDQNQILTFSRGFNVSVAPAICHVGLPMSSSISFYSPTGEQKCRRDKALQAVIKMVLTADNAGGEISKGINVIDGVVSDLGTVISQ
jgi:type II secretory pathway pseudopilin PulG